MLQLAVDQAWFSLFYSLYQSTSTESIKLHSENLGMKKQMKKPKKRETKTCTYFVSKIGTAYCEKKSNDE